MANIIITNNGNPETPAVYDEEGNVVTPAIPAAPSADIKITDANGAVRIISAGQSMGLPLGALMIEVV